MKKTLLIPALALTALLVANACAKYSYFLSDAMDSYRIYSDKDVSDPVETGDVFDEIQENPFITTVEQPVSTFSVDADGAAYAYMRRCVRGGSLPNSNSVRIEEYLNYFTFDYPEPATGETVGINAEVGDCPWNSGHKLLRLGLKGKSIDAQQMPRANFIFLVDTSGSMFGSDRIELLKSGLISLLDNMLPNDRVAIFTYSGEVKKLLGSTPVSDATKIKKIIKSLKAGGSTAGGPAMEMAYKEATNNYLPGGNNRIIMCTDGDFNVGVSSTDALVKMVEQYLEKGIYLSIMGFGTGNFQDSRMESLSNHGNGTYNYIDCEEEIQKVFVDERTRFLSVATDTKCQLHFNPATVKAYRLIGYENRVMKNEDFENDHKDAGEIGVGQTITALYELIPNDSGQQASGEIATFNVRYKLSAGEQSRALTLPVAAPSVGTAPSENLTFASAIATYGLSLRSTSQYKGTASISMALDLASTACAFDPGGYRQGFLDLLTAANALKQ